MSSEEANCLLLCVLLVVVDSCDAAVVLEASVVVEHSCVHHRAEDGVVRDDVVCTDALQERLRLVVRRLQARERMRARWRKLRVL